MILILPTEMPVAQVSSIKSRAAMLGGIFGGASPKPDVKKSPVFPGNGRNNICAHCATQKKLSKKRADILRGK